MALSRRPAVPHHGSSRVSLDHVCEMEALVEGMACSRMLRVSYCDDHDTTRLDRRKGVGGMRRRMTMIGRRKERKEQEM